MKIALSLILILPWMYHVQSASKYFLGESVIMCPNNNQLPAKIKTFEIHNENKVMIYTSLVELNETLKGRLEMVTTLEKCDMDMTKCTSFPPFNFPDICSQINTKFFGPNFLSRTTPKLECPVKAVNILQESLVYRKIQVFPLNVKGNLLF